MTGRTMSEPIAPMRRHALVIGINKYPRIRGANLRGARNDARLIDDVLGSCFGFPAANRLLLLDRQATRAGIEAALDQIFDRIGENDLVTFFYSGHGSQVELPGASYESIVPHDSGRGQYPNRDLTDEEIDRWIQRLNRKTPHVTLIFDCCHCGTMTRDPFVAKARFIEVDRRPPERMFEDGRIPEVLKPSPIRNRRAGLTGPAGYVRGRHRAVAVAACRADEEANECWVGRRAYGILSFGLAWCLRHAAGQANWRDVFERVGPWVTAEYRFQHPQVEGNLDQELFGAREIRPTPYLQVLRVEADRVRLAGGDAHGVTPGSVWSIHPAGTRDSAAEELARVKITAVAAISSRARVLEAEDPSRLEAGQRAFLRVERVAAPGLAIRLEAAGERRAALDGLIRGSPLLREAGDQEPPDVLVRCLDPRTEVAPDDPCPHLGSLLARTWAAVRHDGHLAARTRQAGDARRDESVRSAEQLVGDLERVARYQRVLAIESSDPASRLRGRVRLAVLRRGAGGEISEAEPEQGDGLLAFDEGEVLDLEVHNGHTASVWVTLLVFDCDQSISRLVPLVKHPEYRMGGHELEPGQTLRLSDYLARDARYDSSSGVELTVPGGFPWAAEPGEDPRSALNHLKLMVTPVPADFEFVEQEAALGPPVVRDPGPQSHPLLQLARLYACGLGSRSLTRVSARRPSLDWATITRPIGIRRRGSSPRLTDDPEPCLEPLETSLTQGKPHVY